MSDNNASRARVAVVAVHGISDHVPGETAHLIADALLRQNSNGQRSATYSSIRENKLRIPVHPVIEANRDVVSLSQAASSAEPAPKFDERSQFIRALHKGRPHPSIVNAQAVNDQSSPAARPIDNLADGFMCEQLENYQLTRYDSIYETICLETTRTDPRDRIATDVHIYEVHWSDLLRLKPGIWRVFGELYQALFHLCQIGRQTVDFAFANQSSGRMAWTAFSLAHRMAVRTLTLAVPIFNLFLLTILLLLPLATLSRRNVVVFSRLVPTIALVAVVGWRLLARGYSSFGVWLAAPFLATGAVLGGFALVDHAFLPLLSRIGEYRWMAIESCGIATIVVGAAVQYYERRRPGAKTFTLATAPFLALTLLLAVAQAPNSNYGYCFALLRVIEVLFVAIAVSWLFFLACNWAALILGLLVPLPIIGASGHDAGEISRLRRAIHTAFLSLSLPSGLFLLVTLVAYSALAKVVSGSLGPAAVYPPTWILRQLGHVPDALHPGDLFNRLIAVSSTPAFLLFLYLLVLAVLLCVWGLFPLVWTDVRPPRDTRWSPLLGRWLTFAFRALSLAAACIFLAVPVVLTIGFAEPWTGWLASTLPAVLNDGELLSGVGGLVIGSAAGLLAFHGRLEHLALGFRPALNTILDIDNYLREFPRDATPRARICARYTSLLRYLCRWRDKNDHGYDAIVITAHSQGTVISADLLRFLSKARHNAVASMLRGSAQTITTYLFTVGCPLRQLYSWRFPHLYAWARHDQNERWTTWRQRDIPDDVHPDPYALGVDLWVNAYGSADYVGRYLWRPDRCDYQWLPPVASQDLSYEVDPLTCGALANVSEDTRGSRREFCIGAAAHTHYFDNGSDVIKELDRLIEVATRRRNQR